MKVFRWIGVVIVALLLGWVAVAFDFNIGGILRRILGEKPKAPKTKDVVDDTGDTVGEHVSIIRDNNPMRDKGEVMLSNGDRVELPKGMKDTDVESVTIIEPGVKRVKSKHGRLTDVFDSRSGSG